MPLALVWFMQTTSISSYHISCWYSIWRSCGHQMRLLCPVGQTIYTWKNAFSKFWRSSGFQMLLTQSCWENYIFKNASSKFLCRTSLIKGKINIVFSMVFWVLWFFHLNKGGENEERRKKKRPKWGLEYAKVWQITSTL